MTTTTTRSEVSPQDYLDPIKVFPLSLPSNLSVGNGGCGHGFKYLITWETAFCGLCLIVEGYQEELPKRLHLTKTLADNGNPQQTPKLEAHLTVAEGISTPEIGENLPIWRAKRSKMQTKPSSKLFPFASVLWFLSGSQPPLARVLNLAIRGKAENLIANELQISVLSTIQCLQKAVGLATDQLRKQHGSA